MSIEKNKKELELENLEKVNGGHQTKVRNMMSWTRLEHEQQEPEEEKEGGFEGTW